MAYRWTGNADLDIPHLELLHVAGMQHATIRVRGTLALMANCSVWPARSGNQLTSERRAELLFLLRRAAHDQRPSARFPYLFAGRDQQASCRSMDGWDELSTDLAERNDAAD